MQFSNLADSLELLVNCLEAMIETCIPLEEPEGGNKDMSQYPSMLRVNSNMNLSASMSSLTLGSPIEAEMVRDRAGGSTSSLGRPSFSKQRSKCRAHPDPSIYK